MAGLMVKSDKTKGKTPKLPRKPPISEEDLQLWETAVSDAKPLKNKEKIYKTASTAKPVAKLKKPIAQPRIADARTVRTSNAAEPNPGLDTRTDERLRRGQMPIEARLDLHGLSQDQARTALRNFIIGGQQQGRRCVLVITGKGSMKGGVLKQKVPDWLWESPLRDLVLRFYPAKPQHGGTGALYILLRRNRD